MQLCNSSMVKCSLGVFLVGKYAVMFGTLTDAFIFIPG